MSAVSDIFKLLYAGLFAITMLLGFTFGLSDAVFLTRFYFLMSFSANLSTYLIGRWGYYSIDAIRKTTGPHRKDIIVAQGVFWCCAVYFALCFFERALMMKIHKFPDVIRKYLFSIITPEISLMIVCLTLIFTIILAFWLRGRFWTYLAVNVFLSIGYFLFILLHICLQ
ncbi:MAG: hypothetical protein LBQ54_11490 [Planctomycetaceae bacterium]|nr:hypothetical protein [Planctomycetaceae bacterium]